jgi:hypothetical protein
MQLRCNPEGLHHTSILQFLVELQVSLTTNVELAAFNVLTSYSTAAPPYFESYLRQCFQKVVVC